MPMRPMSLEYVREAVQAGMGAGAPSTSLPPLHRSVAAERPIMQGP